MENTIQSKLKTQYGHFEEIKQKWVEIEWFNKNKKDMKQREKTQRESINASNYLTVIN